MTKSVLLWLVSLVATAVMTAAITMAQSRPTEPRILSGTDIGFRIDGTDIRSLILEHSAPVNSRKSLILRGTGLALV